MPYISDKGERTIGEPIKVLDIMANKVFSKIRKRIATNEKEHRLKKYVAVIYEV